MSKVRDRSEDAQSGRVDAALSGVRARGGVRVEMVQQGADTIARRVGEREGFRVRFPDMGGPLEGILINTGGGMAGGDQVDIELTLKAGAQATFATQAAERIYRSLGSPVEIDIAFHIEAGARLDWLPQETILYSGGRLARRIEVDVASGGTLLMAEMVVFGRTAMGESVETGALNDQWRIRRDGTLVLAEAVRIDGRLKALMERAAIADGARAAATVLYMAPDAESRLEGARAALGSPRAVAAAGAWNGLLTARFLGQRAEDVRADVARLAEWLHGRPLPRAWSM